MATKRPSKVQARQFARLINELEPNVRRGFMASVTDLQANVNWRDLIASLERGDTASAVAALNIDAGAWAEYSSAMSDAYARAGASTAAQIRGTGMGSAGIRFTMTDPGAERWIRENVAERVTNIAQEQVQVVRRAIDRGFQAGAHPYTIARDIVGRSQAGGPRTGGLIGLDMPRAERYEIVAQGMRTAEGVAGLVIEGADGSLSMRYKVNPATERRILNAYRAGQAVPLEDRLISERQYKNALLKARGDTIANTEVANAVMGARDEAWQQAIDKRDIDPSAIIKRWEHRRGAAKHARWQHIEMDGVEVEGLDEPFMLPDGTLMQYAHDPAGGPGQTINCGCSTEYYLREQVA